MIGNLSANHERLSASYHKNDMIIMLRLAVDHQHSWEQHIRTFQKGSIEILGYCEDCLKRC